MWSAARRVAAVSVSAARPDIPPGIVPCAAPS